MEVCKLGPFVSQLCTFPTTALTIYISCKLLLWLTFDPRCNQPPHTLLSFVCFFFFFLSVCCSKCILLGSSSCLALAQREIQGGMLQGEERRRRRWRGATEGGVHLFRNSGVSLAAPPPPTITTKVWNSRVSAAAILFLLFFCFSSFFLPLYTTLCSLLELNPDGKAVEWRASLKRHS